MILEDVDHLIMIFRFGIDADNSLNTTFDEEVSHFI